MDDPIGMSGEGQPVVRLSTTDRTEFVANTVPRTVPVRGLIATTRKPAANRYALPKLPWKVFHVAELARVWIGGVCQWSRDFGYGGWLVVLEVPIVRGISLRNASNVAQLTADQGGGGLGFQRTAGRLPAVASELNRCPRLPLTDGSAMIRFVISLGVLLGIASLGCIDPKQGTSQGEQRDLFDLPSSTTPQAKQVFARPADRYRRYHQKNFEFDLTSDQPGYTGRQFKTLLPDVSPGTQVPCLFYNPAGATAFSGKSAGTAEIDPMLPYVKAGFAVVIYGTDGGTVEITERTSIRSLAKQADQYARAHAGLINARHAIDFVLQEFPQIDAKRLYTIGHSSGGKQALLVAAADPRIAGCVAWAPGCRVSDEEAQLLNSLGRIQRDLPISLLEQSNPMLFAERIKVPLLLVHSSSDEMVPSDDVLGFGERVSGADVLAVPSQNHFDIPEVAQMLTQKWLARLATADGKTLAATTSASTPNDVRPVSNRNANRRTSTRVRQPSRHGKPDTPSIQSNPFAN